MKTVLITGANKGIGLAVVKHLAAKGCHVFLGARNAAAGEEAAASIVKNGGKVTPVLIDVADAKSVEAAAKEFAKSWDRLDVLINNAGLLLKGMHRFLRIVMSYTAPPLRRIRWGLCG